MTNHWRDIKHADVILINGANPAEAHPVGFQWFMKAKLDPTKGPGAGGGAKMIHADPRYTRTSAVSDMYLRIRTGTDVAYFGGLINYVLQNNLYHKEYVEFATNAGHWSSAASSKSASAEARSAIPSGVVGCSLRPNPGKSGTKTEKEEASDRASGSM